MMCRAQPGRTKLRLRVQLSPASASSPPAQPLLKKSRRKTSQKWVSIRVNGLKHRDHRGLQEFFCLCVQTKAGQKRKRSPTKDSSGSSIPAWTLRGVGPLRNRHPGRRSPRPGTAQGRGSAQLEYCSRILEEMLSKKHASSARPFYSLSDAESLPLRDHQDVCRNLMDLSTIKVETASGNTSLSSFFFCIAVAFRYDIFLSFPPFSRKRWTAQSTRTQRASLQTSGWSSPTATDAALLTWRWLHRPGSSRGCLRCCLRRCPRSRGASRRARALAGRAASEQSARTSQTRGRSSLLNWRSWTKRCLLVCLFVSMHIMLLKWTFPKSCNANLDLVKLSPQRDHSKPWSINCIIFKWLI